MAESHFRRSLWLKKIAGEVEAALVTRLRSGEAAPGDALGSRADLARDFVTAAGVIDRALEPMIRGGWVVIGDDGQVRVADRLPSVQGLTLPEAAEATMADVIAILELRMGVETVAVALAAERRSDADLASIRSAADAYAEAAGSGRNAATADFHLHRAIAAASRNSYILELLDTLGPLLIPRMRIAMPGQDGGADANLQQSVGEHSAIVEAIADRDVDAARTAMRTHLLRSIALMRRLGASGDPEA